MPYGLDCFGLGDLFCILVPQGPSGFRGTYSKQGMYFAKKDYGARFDRAETFAAGCEDPDGGPDPAAVSWMGAAAAAAV